MKITIKTQYGDLHSKNMVLSRREIDELKDDLWLPLSNKAASFTLDTDTGFIMIPAEVLKNSVIVVDTI
jgi:hypothetical protein